MTDHRAIAIVTAALEALVRRAATAVPGAAVRIGPPRAAGDLAPGAVEVALTLYHLTANAAWRPAEPSGYDAGGGRRAPAPTRCDLHYCIAVTAGAEAPPLAGDRLLAALVAEFGAQPLLSRAALAAVCAADGDWPELAGPPPDDSVPLTPLYPSPAEAAALWSGLFALPYRPSLHILASAVAIPAAATAAPPPLPVREDRPGG